MARILTDAVPQAPPGRSPSTLDGRARRPRLALESRGWKAARHRVWRRIACCCAAGETQTWTRTRLCVPMLRSCSLWVAQWIESKAGVDWRCTRDTGLCADMATGYWKDGAMGA